MQEQDVKEKPCSIQVPIYEDGSWISHLEPTELQGADVAHTGGLKLDIPCAPTPSGELFSRSGTNYSDSNVAG